MTELADLVICPNCGFGNIQGADSCENCLTDLRTLDVPETSQIVSESDLLLPLAEIRLARLAVVEARAPAREAVRLLQQDPGTAAVVLDHDRIVGIFTERDVLTKLAGQPALLGEPVSRFMTPDPVVLRESDTMAVALNKMGDGGFRHIPLVKDGHLTALVTARDVLNWLMSRYFD
jgi:CBS domain-containing protein